MLGLEPTTGHSSLVSQGSWEVTITGVNRAPHCGASSLSKLPLSTFGPPCSQGWLESTPGCSSRYLERSVLGRRSLAGLCVVRPPAFVHVSCLVLSLSRHCTSGFGQQTSHTTMQVVVRNKMGCWFWYQILKIETLIAKPRP